MKINTHRKIREKKVTYTKLFFSYRSQVYKNKLFIIFYFCYILTAGLKSNSESIPWQKEKKGMQTVWGELGTCPPPCASQLTPTTRTTVPDAVTGVTPNDSQGAAGISGTRTLEPGCPRPKPRPVCHLISLRLGQVTEALMPQFLHL